MLLATRFLAKIRDWLYLLKPVAVKSVAIFELKHSILPYDINSILINVIS